MFKFKPFALLLVFGSMLYIFDAHAGEFRYGHTSKEVTAAPQASSPSKACVDCNTPVPVSSSNQILNIETKVQKKTWDVDCVEESYIWKPYTKWVPQNYYRTEKYIVHEKKPYTKSGTRQRTGVKKVPYEYTSYRLKCVPYTYTHCGCTYTGQKWVKVPYTATGVKNKTYTYEEPYSYTAYRTEQDVRERQVKDVKHVPTVAYRQVHQIVPAKKQITQLQIVKTVTELQTWTFEGGEGPSVQPPSEETTQR